MYRILVSGSLAYDRIMNFPGHFKDHFVAEKLHNINVSFAVKAFTENFGGTAGNIAYNLGLLQKEPSIIATAGPDFDRYITHLQKVGVDTASVQIDKDGATSSAFIVTDQGNNQIAAFAMASGGHQYIPLPSTEGVKAAIIGAGCIEDMTQLPPYYRSKEVQYFYDPGQQIPTLSGDQLRDGITGTEGVFANDYELSLIKQKTGWSESDIVKRARALIVTFGERGSRVITRNESTDVHAVHVSKVIDPTGAGDAYRAGFLAGIFAGSSLENAARLGSVVASYAVEHYGTQNHRFTTEELEARHLATYKEKPAL